MKNTYKVSFHKGSIEPVTINASSVEDALSQLPSGGEEWTARDKVASVEFVGREWSPVVRQIELQIQGKLKGGWVATQRNKSDLPNDKVL